MAKAYLFLTDGFEEIEALATVDILRRAGVEINTVSLTGRVEITASHSVQVIADLLFNQVNFSDADILIIPGGTPKFNDYPELKEELNKFNQRAKKIAAICAAPMVLGEAGFLKGKKATCYPSFEKYLHGAEVSTEAVVVDGNIITGKGPAFAILFALTIVEELLGKDKRVEVETAMLLR